MFFFKNLKEKLSKKNQLKIISGYDFRYSNIGKICEKNIQKYAQFHNFDYEVYKIRNFKERPAAWFKIKILLKLIKETNFKYFLWIDSDAFFCNYENIMENIDKTKNAHMVFHFCKSKLINKNNFIHNFYLGPNMGFFLIKNCSWSYNFLKEIWNKKKYINSTFWEQSALYSMLGINSEINSIKKNKKNNKLMSKIEILPLKWNSIPDRFYFQKQDDLDLSLFTFNPNVIHLAGMRRKYRIKFLKKFKNIFI